ncbi:rho GTPase-activating protein 12-like [Clupea harengus]|uniref:Rho GTPase-activating protein 12-like n=1 Tax=Clupea harengus TaxID=7950 RepID=A0A6P8F3M7_CLUHA|nr:rho GTPase-activating protein 12-like [Clupea harengus]
MSVCVSGKDMAELSIAPGQVYVEVEYDYEYKSRERQISIRQGDCFLLLRKTNDDWWQVRPEGGGRAFYVPAQYVREARRALMPPPKPLLPPPPIATRRSASLKERTHTLTLTPAPNQAGSPVPSPVPSPTASPADRVALLPPTGSAGVVQPPLKHGSLPRKRATSPQRPVPDTEGEKEEERERRRGGGDGGGEREEERERRRGEESRIDSSSGDELSSSSTELLQACPAGGQRPDSPVYTNLAELKLSSSSLPPAPSSPPLHTQGSWETHLHHSGRNFYYNTHTHERSWKPPFRINSVNFHP